MDSATVEKIVTCGNNVLDTSAVTSPFSTTSSEESTSTATVNLESFSASDVFLDITARAVIDRNVQSFQQAMLQQLAKLQKEQAQEQAKMEELQKAMAKQKEKLDAIQADLNATNLWLRKLEDDPAKQVVTRATNINNNNSSGKSKPAKSSGKKRSVVGKAKKIVTKIDGKIMAKVPPPSPQSII